jgi:hypothetical protein
MWVEFIVKAVCSIIAFIQLWTQLAEWYCMYFIIAQQKDRDVNEILYDFNAENMSAEIDENDKF